MKINVQYVEIHRKNLFDVRIQELGGISGSYFDLARPPPADLVEFLWFKMTGTGVPHVVLHVLGSTRTFYKIKVV